ncbi:MAG: aspartate/glutamate racemase family protein [Natronospirillum sp.]
MKTIGLLGGMSWESTVIYYRAINEAVRETLGGFHSAPITLHSVDFHHIEALQHAGDWVGAGHALADAARLVEAGGADFLVLCTNTMHKVAPSIENAISIPLLHIADATAEALVSKHYQRVGLLGTQFTMEQNFYKGRLGEHYGLDVRVPDSADQQRVHQIIYEELCQGVVREESRQVYLDIINKLHAEGAQAIILGCTEIGLLVKPEHTPVPLFDTTLEHVNMAVKRAMDV